MKVSVPMAGEGVAGDPYRPSIVLHGKMHLDPQARVVTYTDTSFTDAELAQPGVTVIEGAPEAEPEPTPEPSKTKRGSTWTQSKSTKR